MIKTIFQRLIFVFVLFSAFLITGCDKDSAEDAERAKALEEAEKGVSEETKAREGENLARLEQEPPPTLPQPMPICDRTAEVQRVILNKLNRIDCSEVTDKKLGTILIFHLNGTGLTEFQRNDFSGLTSLQELDLGINELTSLSLELFSGLSSLQELDLSFNDLTSLPSGLFSGLTSLQELNLYGNELTTLPPGLFSGLSSLQELDLGINDLTSLPSGLFSGLTSLQELDLGYNELTTLPPGLFSGLTALEEVTLRYNELTSEEKARLRQELEAMRVDRTFL